MRCFCRRDGVRKGVRVEGDKILYCMFCNFGTHKEKPTTSDGTNELCYEDDVVVGFQTRKKKAQEHYLVIPKRHIESIKDLTPLTSEEDRKLLHHMLRVGKKLMKSHGKSSFHFHIPPFNSISHLHMHCIKPPYTNPMWKLQFSNNGISSVDIETVLNGTIDDVRRKSFIRIFSYVVVLVLSSVMYSRL